MAGAGWRAFTRQVLPSSVVQEYLMDQAVMTFASASARSAALTAPSDGMVTYLADTDRLELRTGGAWQLLWQPSNITGTAETLAVTSIASGWSVASTVGRILGTQAFMAVVFTRTGAAIAQTAGGAIANIAMGVLPAKYAPAAPTPLQNFGQGRGTWGYMANSGTMYFTAFNGTASVGTGENIELGAIYPLNAP